MKIKREVKKMKLENQFEAFVNYAEENYTSRVNASNLLGLEQGLKENLERVQERLSQNYAYDDDRSIREVLQDETVSN